MTEMGAQEQLEHRRAINRRYYVKNKEKELERLRVYRILHPEKRRATLARSYKKNKLKHRAGVYKWRLSNKEKQKEINRKSYAKCGRETSKIWAKNNPGKKSSYRTAHRCRKLLATPPWVDFGAIEAFYREAVVRGLTVDHIVPLNNKFVCGLHVPWNLQLLTKSENSRKSNSFSVF